ncbi:IS256 family transposase, partial [Limosilactobacillus fermentum]
EAVNVAIGIRSDGGKEVLDYSIAPTENGAAWSELLQGLRARGIKDIQLFIADGLVGLQSAIEANYPQAKFQRCWVHAERNLLGYVRKNDRREIITDFKAIRQAENLQAA